MNEEVTKFCKDCIHSILSHRSGYTDYECYHPNNAAGADIVDGQPIVSQHPRMLRTNSEACGMEAKWFEQKALTVGYVGLGYIPGDKLVTPGETMQERLARLRSMAAKSIEQVGRKTVTSKSLKNITIDDL